MKAHPTLKALISAPVRALAIAGFLAMTCAPAGAAEEAPHPPNQDWSFEGIFGTWDLPSIQRGFQVYQEVCSTCHAMNLMSYRNLEEVGFTPAEVEAVAGGRLIDDGPDDTGNMFQRAGLPSDRFVAPFANEQAARAANNGAYPKDLSVIVKAREGGADYIYALMTGYEEPPADMEMSAGMHYNEYFPGHQIAMPEILLDGSVNYQDGSPTTVEQYAWDVTNFLTWSAEPKLEARKRMGVKVILFLLVFTGLMYAVKRKVWASVH